MSRLADRMPQVASSSKGVGTSSGGLNLHDAHRCERRENHSQGRINPMTTTHEIAPHLPYLRRFARALCGHQQSGDAYVVALLESLVADPSLFPRGMDARVALSG